jgi:hypothetical protein
MTTKNIGWKRSSDGPDADRRSLNQTLSKTFTSFHKYYGQLYIWKIWCLRCDLNVWELAAFVLNCTLFESHSFLAKRQRQVFPPPFMPPEPRGQRPVHKRPRLTSWQARLCLWRTLSSNSFDSIISTFPSSPKHLHLSSSPPFAFQLNPLHKHWPSITQVPYNTRQRLYHS